MLSCALWKRVCSPAKFADIYRAGGAAAVQDVYAAITLEDAPLRGGRLRRIAASGEVRIIDGDGQFRVRPGNPTNLYGDIATNLGAVANNANLVGVD
jgi:hypothetical protein